MSTAGGGPDESGPSEVRDLEEAAEQPTPAPLPVLSEPAEGVPDVVTTERALLECAEAIARGSGPVALDAERASGYRYGQRAYLVQVRRDDAGTWLLDPMAVPDLSPLARAIGSGEWLLHAATQALACLAEVGLRPRQLFDTELAARLLGLPRVGLAAVVEHYLGLSLAKEHSAVDWSTRPLPEPWLRYAALDVEVLGEVRNLMGIDLAVQGKAEWARQEFEALLTWQPAVKDDPWRRTSGMHKIRKPRVLATVRELWYARDAIAQGATSPRPGRPGRGARRHRHGLPDDGGRPADLAAQRAALRPALARRGRAGRGAARLRAAPVSVRTDAPPPQRSWPDHNPSPRPGSRRPARCSRPSPRRTRSRSRTSARPTRCVASCGRHRSRPTPPASRRRSPHGVRPWQRGRRADAGGSLRGARADPLGRRSSPSIPL